MVNLVAISIKENESVRDVLKQSSASYKRLSKDEGLCRDRGEKGTLELSLIHISEPTRPY